MERSKTILRREIKYLVIAVATIAPLANPATAAPPEPGWAKQIVPTGQERAIIKSTPIELRPYRPFHFYGNTVRRLHYRGNPIPAPRDIISTATVVIPTR